MVERDEVDVKEVFIAQIPLQCNRQMHSHMGEQVYSRGQINRPQTCFILLQTVVENGTNRSYWRVVV